MIHRCRLVNRALHSKRVAARDGQREPLLFYIPSIFLIVASSAVILGVINLPLYLWGDTVSFRVSTLTDINWLALLGMALANILVVLSIFFERRNLSDKLATLLVITIFAIAININLFCGCIWN